LAASVASAFIDDTAAWRPRMTGRIVRGKEASGPWAMALAAKVKQQINMLVTSALSETVMSASAKLRPLGLPRLLIRLNLCVVHSTWSKNLGFTRCHVARAEPVWPSNLPVGSRKLKLALAADCERITKPEAILLDKSATRASACVKH